MSKSIDVILFDLGGVLVELAGVDQMIAWSKGITSHEELWRRWLESSAVRRFETGAIGRDDFAAAVIDEFFLRTAYRSKERVAYLFKNGGANRVLDA